MDSSANTPTANVMNTDVPNNVSSKQEFHNHQKLHSNSFKCRLKNKHKNSATAAKPKEQPQSDNKIHPIVEVNSDSDPFDKVLKFKINPNFSSEVKMDFEIFWRATGRGFQLVKRKLDTVIYIRFILQQRMKNLFRYDIIACRQNFKKS